MLATELAESVKPYSNRNKFSFPSDEINPKIKDNEEWYLQNAYAILSEYANNGCHTKFKFVENEHSYETLDMYAQSKQGNAKIKGVMLNKENMKNGKYVTRMNVRWDCPAIMAKMFDVLRSIQQRIEYRVGAHSIDPGSVNARNLDRAMMKFVLDQKTKELIEYSNFKPNLPVDPEQIGLMNDSQVDLFYDAGGIVVDIEIMAQIVCETTKHISGFKNIHDQVNDDLIKYAFACGESTLNPNTMQAECEWINAKNAIIPESDYLDFHDIPYYGYVKMMTIGELKQKTKLSDPQIISLARKFQGLNKGLGGYLNSIGNYAGLESIRSNGYGQSTLAKVRVPVLKCQWLSSDYNYYLQSERFDQDTPMFKEVEYGYKVKESEKKKKGESTMISQKIRKHECMLVIGTNILISHGEAKNVPQYGDDGNKTPRLDLFAIQTGNQSLVSRCISHIDDLHEATVKRRQAIKSIPPAPRMIIMRQLFDNVMVNGKKQTAKDITTGFTEDGVMILDGLDAFGKPIFQSGKPIDFLPTGIGEDINIFSAEINNSIMLIRDVLGLNAAMDGSDPQPRDGYKRTLIAAESANNAIFPTFNKYKDWFEAIMADIVRKWQIGGKLKSHKISFNMFGQRTQQILELTAPFCLAEFNIKVDMVYGDLEKERMIANLVALKASRAANGGTGGITESDYLMLEEMINAGNTTLAKFMLAQVEQWRAMADEAKIKAREQANNESAAAASERSELAKQKTIMLQEGEKRKTEALKKALEIKGDIVKALVSKEQVSGQYDADIAIIAQEADAIITMTLEPQFKEQAAVQAQEQAAGEKAAMGELMSQTV